jgi:cysteine desulfurase
MTLYYFDNNASTRVLPQVLTAMLPWFGQHYANASSSHSAGQIAKQALMSARTAVANLLHASPAEMVFTSGASESNHLAIHAALTSQAPRQRIITSAIEHSSQMRLFSKLAEQGYEIIYLPVNAQGEVSLTHLQAALNTNTALVSIMHVNNETGVIQPIAQAAELAHAQGALFHTDAAQSAGKLEIDVRTLGCDLLSFSGHKLHAAKGVGALFVRKGLTLPALIHGHQERNRRGGTENQAGIVGLGVACQLALVPHNEHIARLRDDLEQRILAHIPCASINGEAPRVCNTSNICFNGIAGEALLHHLDQAGIMVSLGSACNASGTQASHVLLAMGLSAEQALASVRFSLSQETTQVDVDYVLQHLISITQQLLAQDSLAA